MPKRRKLADALDRLAAAEERAFACEFLAPMLRGGIVQVRIAGVVCRLAVQPGDFEGWGIFRSTSPNTAALVRPARLAERREYLELLALVRLILCHREEDQWFAMPAHRADSRFRIEGLVPVRLVEDPDLFEVVQTRFDGTQCWYEGPDPRRDPAAAAYLREALARMEEPGRLSRPGLAAEERAAYSLNYARKLEAELEARRDLAEERLRAALEHAGAELREYVERGDVYRVTYEIAGRRQVSVISRADLSVHAAGICLSGQDRRFDLQSLVGVIREAREGGGIVRVGVENDGMPEEAYWDAHPPEP